MNRRGSCMLITGIFLHVFFQLNFLFFFSSSSFPISLLSYYYAAKCDFWPMMAYYVPFRLLIKNTGMQHRYFETSNNLSIRLTTSFRQECQYICLCLFTFILLTNISLLIDLIHISRKTTKASCWKMIDIAIFLG